VSICPGLAITLVRRVTDDKALVVLPWEFNVDSGLEEDMELVDQKGEILERARIISRRKVQKRNTWLLTFEVDVAHAARIAGVRRLKTQKPARLQEKAIELENSSSIMPVDKSLQEDLDTVVCRCERITLREIVDFIKRHDVKDANQLKSLRVGMAHVEGKHCSQLNRQGI